MPTATDSVTAQYGVPGAAALRSPQRYLLWLVARQRGRAALGAFLSIVWMVSLALTPYLLGRATDDGLRRGGLEPLLPWIGVLLAVGALTAFVAIMRHRTMTRVRLDAAYRTVHAVVVHSTTLGNELSRRTTTGEIATIGMTDAWVISNTLTVVGPGVGAIVATVVVAFLLFAQSPLLAAVVLLGLPLVVVLIGPILGRLQRRATVYRERQGRLTARMVDVVQGLHVLNGVGGKPIFSSRYQQGSSELRDEGYRVASIASWIPAIAVGAPVVFLAGVTWLAARMVADGDLSVGGLVGAYGYVAFLVVPLATLIESATDINQGLVAARRVVSFLSAAPTAPPANHEAGPVAGTAALHDPDSGVTLRPGSFTAIASALPVDALTIVDRLGGFSPSEVTWGGQRLAAIEPAEVRQRILVADNGADLFAGPLREVVSGRFDRDDAQLVSALHTAAAEDILTAAPEGLATAIAPQGRNFSGGQRQRIRLARAVAAEPEILLASEPTSAVDAYTETVIAQRLRAARTGLTTLVTTTSPAVLDVADIVYFVVDGKVTAQGTHHELLDGVPGYQLLVSRALGESGPDESPTSGRS
ncbi:ABC transporter transmembrane domain-containing protein [Kribbella sp. CA-293567]|uniref:ABC transporter transmembrane domain-containing protein n=1 Tax=Kribbella sp. CA-293567 TaxID=3002436 RepID=UPI0022DE63A8|nr:ABC transporter ATP-binding protein [Kribbella sp. CA-293567]WBQ05066.1 ABC transporter ATP-binding protein [Kribbella sp. CA-293567]